MSAGEVAAVIVAVAVAMGMVGVLFTMAAAVRAIGTFRRAVEDITGLTIPLIADVHVGITQANADLMKVDVILDNAETIQTTIDAASRLTYTAVANPVVKAMAAGTGVAKAYRSLWRRKKNAA
ncbi:MAG: hypothetical protein ACRD2W_15210 [Acidimicrobiales bacterium]